MNLLGPRCHFIMELNKATVSGTPFGMLHHSVKSKEILEETQEWGIFLSRPVVGAAHARKLLLQI